MPLTGNQQETLQKKVEVNDWTPKIKQYIVTLIVDTTEGSQGSTNIPLLYLSSQVCAAELVLLKIPHRHKRNQRAFRTSLKKLVTG